MNEKQNQLPTNRRLHRCKHVLMLVLASGSMGRLYQCIRLLLTQEHVCVCVSKESGETISKPSTSYQTRVPAKFKHIIKRRKRKQKRFPK